MTKAGSQSIVWNIRKTQLESLSQNQLKPPFMAGFWTGLLFLLRCQDALWWLKARSYFAALVNCPSRACLHLNKWVSISSIWLQFLFAIELCKLETKCEIMQECWLSESSLKVDLDCYSQVTLNNQLDSCLLGRGRHVRGREAQIGSNEKSCRKVFIQRGFW